MSVLGIVLILVLVGVLLTVLVSLSDAKPSVKQLIGVLTGTTCNAQTHEIFNLVLENEVLFNLVKEVDTSFSGYEYRDVNNINTSKFANLVAKYNTIPTQVTSAERYFRNYRAGFSAINKKNPING